MAGRLGGVDHRPRLLTSHVARQFRPGRLGDNRCGRTRVSSHWSGEARRPYAAGVRQILLPVRASSRVPDQQAIVLPTSWHASGPVEIEQLFMVAATPNDPHILKANPEAGR